ncbi:hypothetical protein ACFW3D_06780 [Streptomyces sp. NPDC058864]
MRPVPGWRNGFAVPARPACAGAGDPRGGLADGRAPGRAVARPGTATGLFKLLRATVAVLMIARPRSSAGA